MKFCSLILTHYGSTKERSELMKLSVKSLIDSLDYPTELIVVDNGNVPEDSNYLLDLTTLGLVQLYIRNANNMHFGYARDQGIDLCHGEYICIVDNDLIYKKGWLSECINVLESTPDQKYYATPMPYQTNRKFDRGTLTLNGKVYDLNSRAGSNCFVIRRTDLDTIGHFQYHRIAGSRWTDAATKAFYLAIVLPSHLVSDEGFRKGYDFTQIVPINLTLSDGTKINFNQDL
jgi:glycosyltransferase involved in cell wall biosynthesis